MNDDKYRVRLCFKQLKWLKKEAQRVFNAYIRARDKDDPCISCGKFRESYDAGHYFSVGSSPSVRFDEDNVHKECKYCNYYASPKDKHYKENLIKKIGLERFNRLELERNKTVSRNKLDYIDIILRYR